MTLTFCMCMGHGLSSLMIEGQGQNVVGVGKSKSNSSQRSRWHDHDRQRGNSRDHYSISARLTDGPGIPYSQTNGYSTLAASLHIIHIILTKENTQQARVTNDLLINSIFNVDHFRL